MKVRKENNTILFFPGETEEWNVVLTEDEANWLLSVLYNVLSGILTEASMKKHKEE